MKMALLVLACILLPFLPVAQDAEEILTRSYDTCQSVRQGVYQMTEYMKYISEKDTFQTNFETCFRKPDGDSLFPVAFHTRAYYNEKLTLDVMYTGDELVNINHRDSVATLTSSSQWPGEIESIKHNYSFYTPVTGRECYPLPHGEDFTDGKHSFLMHEEEMVGDRSCYHIQMNKEPENEEGDKIITLRVEFHFWIDRVSFLPLQYSITYDLLMDNDTMCQYERLMLQDHSFDALEDETELTLGAIPSGYVMKEYVPYERPRLLPVDTVAPSWSLTSLHGDTVSLESLRGKLILVDFFYKSCLPCMQALPALQRLHGTYRDQGLAVIGIDPYDEPEVLAEFLEKRGVTYTILLGGREAAGNYHVTGYPTMYLIDPGGKIVFVQEGYGEGVDEVLEEQIKKNLSMSRP